MANNAFSVRRQNISGCVHGGEDEAKLQYLPFAMASSKSLKSLCMLVRFSSLMIGVRS